MEYRENNKYSNIDEKYMKIALELAIKAQGHTSPNPMVGCVIVKDGRIIGLGYHKKCGELHAERNAFSNCTESPEGADLYVTLEPCCHYGKTPPCTEAIIEHKIKRVFVGCTDNNPLVDNKGIEILKEHKIEVITGVLEEECRKINEVFFHYITYKTPFIVMKYAMTLDGKIASVTGDSKWITSEKSRRHVHILRNQYKGILVGINTVIEDDSILDCRMENGVNPIRIICDTNLDMPIDCKIVSTADKIPTIIAIGCNKIKDDKKAFFEKRGIKILKVDTNDVGRIDLVKLFNILGNMEIDSILVEGGGSIHGELLSLGIIDKVYAYIAPKLIGGDKAKSPIRGEGLEYMSQAIELSDVSVERFDNDILISGYIKSKEER